MTLATLVVKLVGDIGPFVTAMDNAQKSARSGASGIAGAINGALGGIGNVAMIGAGAAVAGAAAIGTAALAAAMDLDEAYDTIITKTGATGDALSGLQDDFRAVFTAIPTDAAAAGDVISELNRRLGLTGPPLQDLSKNLLEMSRITGGDAASNAAAFSRVMGDWGISAKDASAKLNELFVVSQKTGIGTDALMEKVVQFGSPMRLMGFSIEDTAALLGKWEKEGVNSELVMGSLRIAAGKFAKEGKPLRDSLLQTFTSIQNNKDATAALALGMKVFGAKAGPDMVAAIREGRLAIDDLVTAMQNGGDAIKTAANATNDFPEKLQIMKNKAEVILAPLGSLIMEGISRGLDVLAPALDKAGSMMQDFMEGATAGGDFDFFQGLANVFYGLAGTDTGSVFQGIGDALMNLQAIAQPAIDGIVSGIQNLIAWVQQNWPQIKNTIVSTWNSIRSVVEPIVNAIGSFIGSVFSTVRNFLESHGEDIKAFVGQAWATIQSIIEGAAQIISTIFGGIAQFINDNQTEIQSIISFVWDGIKTVIGTALEVIRGIVNAVLALLHGDIQGALDAIGQMFSNIWDSIKGAVAQALETLRMIIEIAWFTIRQGVENFLNGIAQAWDTFWGVTIPTAWNNFVSGITGAWNQFWGTTLPAAWQNFVAVITGAWNTFWGTTLPGAWNNFKTAITTAWNQFWGTTLPGLWTLFKNKITGEWNTFWGTTIPQAWANFVAAITLSWNTFWGTTIPAAINSAMDFIRGIPDKFVEFGRNLIQGLVNGIKNAGASIKQALEDVVNGAVNWFKNLLGIESPSTVMAGFGEMMMRGLAKGIKDNTRLPQLAFDEATADFSIEARAAASPAMSRVGPIGAAGQGGNTNYSSSMSWSVTTDENGLRMLLEQQRMQQIRAFEGRM